ncbi:hypothetical protein D3C75_997190 [compost metagenome]
MARLVETPGHIEADKPRRGGDQGEIAQTVFIPRADIDQDADEKAEHPLADTLGQHGKKHFPPYPISSPDTLGRELPVVTSFPLPLRQEEAGDSTQHKHRQGQGKDQPVAGFVGHPGNQQTGYPGCQHP